MRTRERKREKEREIEIEKERERERENGRVLARMCFCLKKNQRNSLRRIYKCLSANIYIYICIYKSEEKKEIFMRFHEIRVIKKKKDFTFEFHTNCRKKKIEYSHGTVATYRKINIYVFRIII